MISFKQPNSFSTCSTRLFNGQKKIIFATCVVATAAANCPYASCSTNGTSSDLINKKESNIPAFGNGPTSNGPTDSGNLLPSSTSQTSSKCHLQKQLLTRKEKANRIKYKITRFVCGGIPGCIFFGMSLIMILHVYIVSGCMWALASSVSFLYHLEYMNPEDQDWRQTQQLLEIETKKEKRKINKKNAEI